VSGSLLGKDSVDEHLQIKISFISYIYLLHIGWLQFLLCSSIKAVVFNFFVQSSPCGNFFKNRLLRIIFALSQNIILF